MKLTTDKSSNDLNRSVTIVAAFLEAIYFNSSISLVVDAFLLSNTSFDGVLIEHQSSESSYLLKLLS